MRRQTDITPVEVAISHDQHCKVQFPNALCCPSSQWQSLHRSAANFIQGSHRRVQPQGEGAHSVNQRDAPAKAIEEGNQDRITDGLRPCPKRPFFGEGFLRMAENLSDGDRHSAKSEGNPKEQGKTRPKKVDDGSEREKVKQFGKRDAQKVRPAKSTPDAEPKDKPQPSHLPPPSAPEQSFENGSARQGRDEPLPQFARLVQFPQVTVHRLITGEPKEGRKKEADDQLQENCRGKEKARKQCEKVGQPRKPPTRRPHHVPKDGVVNALQQTNFQLRDEKEPLTGLVEKEQRTLETCPTHRYLLADRRRKPKHPHRHHCHKPPTKGYHLGNPPT